MNFKSLAIPDVKVFTPRIIQDDRGYFMETFKVTTFNQAVGHEITFVQDNQSFSKDIYTLRGLHYQSPPHAQGKLIRCTRGKILDVAVDARKNSPHYGQHVKIELSADTAEQLWVPAGFLHGFATLAANTEVQYKCTAYYAHECDGNVMWDDPELAIDWGFEPHKAVISQRDAKACTFASFNSPF
ncbi:MAG: dTDP-4-dehydrorhamnose 3,5-epimerase [Robiginitomaculum sp.]|nr:MAG: dTDP-4-dehydrorhamnose 3,5-epimerase [Robiginitomaculum sp.]